MKPVTLPSAVATAALLLLLLQPFVAADAETAAKATAPVPPAVAAEANVAPQPNPQNKEKLFLANYATSTELRLSITTSTVPLSCFSLISATACLGRSARFDKNRALFKTATGIIGSADSEAPNLDGSMTESKAVEPGDTSTPVVGTEVAKNFFTVWSVAYSTATLTTTVTMSSITVSLSAMCFPAGGEVPPMCGR